MRDFFTLDQTPCDEPCASVGEPDYDAPTTWEGINRNSQRTTAIPT